MNMNAFYIYLAVINAIGFLLSFIGIKLMKRGSTVDLGLALVVIALVGGGLGMLISFAVFNPKPCKENMLSRLCILCIFIIEAITLLLLINHSGTLDLNIFAFFASHKILLIYLCIINVVTFAAFGLDKYNAVKDKSRIRIVTLLGLCFIGGSVGGLIGMYAFRHKTRTNYFTIGVPLIILVQLCILIFIMNI